MGGLLIVVSIVLPTLLWSDLSNKFVWLAVFSTLAFGAIGFSDDYLKVVHKQNLGLNGRSKLLLQTLVAFVIAVALILLQARGLYSTHLMVPFFQANPPGPGGERAGRQSAPVAIAFLPFIIFVIFVLVGSTNAVNLTDGLDGLAIGCTLIAAGALAVLTYLSGNAVSPTI